MTDDDAVLAEAQAILESGQFDASFYAEQARETFAEDLAAILHYVSEGEARSLRPTPSFDPGFYLARYPDLAGWTGPLLLHYIRYGMAEGRRGVAEPEPVPSPEEDAAHPDALQIRESGQFDAGFYAEQAGERFANDFAAILHYTSEGEARGLKPAPSFDPGFYLARYPDLAGWTGPLLLHYIRHGMAEGRRGIAEHEPANAPSPEEDAAHANARRIRESGQFDAAFYAEQTGESFPDDFAAILHYVSEGEARGLKPAPSFDPAYYSARYPDLTGWKHPLFLHYLRHGMAEGRRGIAEPEPANAPSPEEDAAHANARRIRESGQFDAAFYAEQTGESFPDDFAAILHYVSEGEARGLKPTPSFDPGFYSARYPDLAGWTGPFFLHYIRHGMAEGRRGFAEPEPAPPPEEDAAHANASRIRESGQFDAAFYAEQTGESFPDDFAAILHYVREGETRGLRPAPAFDPAFYAREYPDLGAWTGPLFLHYVRHGFPEGRRGSAEPPRSVRQADRHSIQAILDSGLFDVEYYSEACGLNFESPKEAAEHYVKTGEAEGTRPGPKFDPVVYRSYRDLENYPGCLLLHYRNYGRAEGRIAVLDLDGHVFDGAQAYDKNKDTILLVAHEASRTGAPIVALNVAEYLRPRFNVIMFLMRDGEIASSFLQYCHLLYNPGDIPIRAVSPDLIADRLLKPLLESFGISHFVANSMETDNVVMALNSLQMPTLTLIHEFAEYVIPKKRMVDIMEASARVVFSSQLTESSARNYVDAAQFEKSAVFPQGRCVPPPSDSEAVDPDLERLMEAKRQGKGICLGCGTVQIRKGVDLFLQAASYCISRHKSDALFVWVGEGYSPETDWSYSVWLKDQITRSGLQDNVLFLPAVSGACLEEIYALSDVMFLSSRLDPFPNVTIDALWARLPIVCFDDASGIAEYLLRDPDLAELVVPYLDTAAAADRISSLLRRGRKVDEIKSRLGHLAESRFSMKAYVDQIVAELELLRGSGGRGVGA